MTSRDDVRGIKQNQICNLCTHTFHLRYHSTTSDLKKGGNANPVPILCVDLLLLWRHRMFQFAKSKRKKLNQYFFFFREVPPNHPTPSSLQHDMQVRSPYYLARQYVTVNSSVCTVLTSQEEKKHFSPPYYQKNLTSVSILWNRDVSLSERSPCTR